jgi:hypothetical protein
MHDASGYRKIIRESKAKKGKDLEKLLDEARDLRDPYYAALALFTLSSDKRFDQNAANAIAQEALEISKRVEMQWRQAELLCTLVKKMRSWRKGSTVNEIELLQKKIIEIITEMPEGQGLSDAVKGCSSVTNIDHLRSLLGKGLTNTGFEVQDSKPVIRQWVTICKRTKRSCDELIDILQAVKDASVRAQLSGYLHLQLARAGFSGDYQPPLQTAVDAALEIAEGERDTVLRYLSQTASTKSELLIVAHSIDQLVQPEEKARALAALGGSADKAGHSDLAVKWFNEGLDAVSGVQDIKTRVKIELNLASGLARSGETDQALKAYQEALQNGEEDEALRAIIYRSMKNNGFEVDIDRKERSKESVDQKRGIRMESEIEKNTTNNILALYDTYEGGLKTIHLRAVARSAPLCIAFGLDLALMGFPAKNLDQLIGQVISETDIGKGGKYLKELAEQGRITLVDCTQKEPPTNWEELGLPVATTSKPRNDKQIVLHKALLEATEKHPKKRACLIMGLGKRGLPRSLLETVPYHLELTGRNIALETCTAMGVIAQKLADEN